MIVIECNNCWFRILNPVGPVRSEPGLPLRAMWRAFLIWVKPELTGSMKRISTWKTRVAYEGKSNTTVLEHEKEQDVLMPITIRGAEAQGRSKRACYQKGKYTSTHINIFKRAAPEYEFCI